MLFVDYLFIITVVSYDFLSFPLTSKPYNPQFGLNFVFITVYFIWMVCDRHLQNGEFSKETSCSHLVHQCISQRFGVRLAILKNIYYKSSLLWSNIKSWSARSAQPGFGMGGGFGSGSYYDHHQSLWVKILNRLWGLGFRIREGYGWESYHDHQPSLLVYIVNRLCAGQ